MSNEDWNELDESYRSALSGALETAHPAVEQAGGDERAAFEQWLEQHMSHHFSPELDLAKYEDSGEYRYNPAADYWKAWQARAALAQPSQAQAEQAEGAHVPDEVFAGVFAEWWEEEGQYCRAGGGDYERTFAFQAWRHLYPLLLQARAALAQTHPSPAPTLRAAIDVANDRFEVPVAKWGTNLVGEEERPEVVASVVHSNPVVLGQCGPLNANDELMTVAQHAASVARWAEMFNRVEQERDAALAEVERLRESKGDPVGSLEKCMKVMYERDEHAKRLEAALARVAGLEAELETERMRLAGCGVAALGYFDGCADAYKSASLSDVLRLRADCDAALAEVAGLRSLLNSLLCYVERDINRMRSDRDKSDNKEIYDRSISLAMERLKAAQNAVFTTEPGCDTAVELAAQTTQAQHSVPIAPELKRALGLVVAALEADGDRPTSKYALSELKKVRAAAHVCHLSRNALTEAQMRRLYENSTETENERLGFEAFARLIRRAEAVHQITAAPGKEVGHE
ncbi:TPA: hypothetical protein SLU31_002209 [Pseudomonas aeruginosa]|nr:hypothetical protein [Pseudomonas aeruginosa]